MIASPAPAPRLARNAALNVAGQLVQLLAAIVAVPILVRGLGPDRFGAFQLVWVVIGYLFIVDFGLGRATTRFVADALGRHAPDEIPDIAWSAAGVQALLGVIGAAALIAGSTALARLIEIPAAIVPEFVAACRWIALALPALLLTASFSGVLEAHQRFDLVNYVRIPAGVAAALAPVAALALGGGLPGVVVSVVIVRWLAAAAYLAVGLATVPSLRAMRPPRGPRVRALLGFGSWVTVSNVISPLMTYLDRFVIGARLGLVAVAHYTAPFDAIMRASIVPASLAQALFPAFTTLHAREGRDAVSRVAVGAFRVMCAVMGALAAAVVVGAHGALTIWLGPSFADAAARALQLLAIGVVANALAQIPYAALQGAGRADITALLHLVELPVYAAMLWWLAGRYGIEGAALAWSLRCVLDALLLYGAAQSRARLQLIDGRALAAGVILPMVVAGAMAAIVPAAAAPALALSFLIFTAATWTGWRASMGPDERAAALRLLRPRPHLPPQ